MKSAASTLPDLLDGFTDYLDHRSAWSSNADLWYGRAERLLDEALDAIRAERIDDALSNASLAVAVMHVPDGTQDATEFDGYSWPGEPEDESDCICTPEQLESGGFMGRCPVHGYGLRMEVGRGR